MFPVSTDRTKQSNVFVSVLDDRNFPHDCALGVHVKVCSDHQYSDDLKIDRKYANTQHPIQINMYAVLRLGLTIEH